MAITLSNKNNGWILRQYQAAAFYQAENWSAVYAIEHVVEEAGEEGGWDVAGRFSQLEQRFAGKRLDALDLNLFLDGAYVFMRTERKTLTIGSQKKLRPNCSSSYAK
jgi:hypothetical protein